MYLLDQKANINEKNKDGKTPLWLAMNQASNMHRRGNAEVVKFLMSRGAQ